MIEVDSIVKGRANVDYMNLESKWFDCVAVIHLTRDVRQLS